MESLIGSYFIFHFVSLIDGAHIWRCFMFLPILVIISYRMLITYHSLLYSRVTSHDDCNYTYVVILIGSSYS
jgi:hypothetical protein